eukprot:1673216-Heterocapsa_arctica.AAC.1
MMPFDKTLMNDKGKVLPPSLEHLSGIIFDAAIGNNVAWERKWKPLERVGNQWLGWYPWGVMQRHLLDPLVWGEDMTDKDLWTAITETKNHREGYYSFMIK